MPPKLRTVDLVRGRGGFGFTVSGQAPSYVSWIKDGSSAAGVGLKRGDTIVSVGGQNVYNSSHEHVVKLIGMSNNILHLQVQERIPDNTSSSGDEDVAKPAHFSSVRSKRRLIQGQGQRKPPLPTHTRSNRDDFDFNRTEQVINELKSGALFQSVLTAIDANSPARDSGTKSSRTSKSRSKHRSRDRWSDNSSSGNQSRPSHKRNISLQSDNYNKNNSNSNNFFLQSILAYLGTVEIPVSIPEEVPQASLEAMQACVQQLRREQYVHQRVLLKVTQTAVKLFSADGDVIAVYEGRRICFSSVCPNDSRFFCIVTSLGNGQIRCHQFMVDPDICAHRHHAERAKRFGIHCSMDSETGNCTEFPRSPRILLKMVEALFGTHDKPPSDIAPVIAAPELGDLSGGSISTTDSGIDGINGSVLKNQKNSQGQTTNRNRKKKEVQDSKLSQQNLKKHDLKNINSLPDNLSRFAVDGSVFPAQNVGSGSYRPGAGTLPNQKSNQSNSLRGSHTQELRLSKRGRKTSRAGEGLFFRVPKRSSSRHRKPNLDHVMSKSSESISVAENALSGASSIESLASNASLPSCINGLITGHPQNGRDGFVATRVTSWSMNFDKLLDDELGVKYFTEFLRKEFSQENILFWLECEKLRKTPDGQQVKLKEISDGIYDRFLSVQATSPVNIDSKGQRLSEEARNQPAHPNMFDQQQNQIYKLMKLDSYSRFLKSPLYRQCVVAEIGGTPLPLDAESTREFSVENHVESRHSFSLKHRRFFQRNSSKSRKSQGSNDSIHRDSSDSESGFLEAINRDDPTAMLLSGLDAGKICRLTLWDGSSTVMMTATGQATIREALGSLCERRGVPLSAVDIYYLNEDRALALDQDVSVLAGQEVRVERRTIFRLDMVPIGRSVGVKAKPTKPIGEVLRPVVAKYGLQLEDMRARLSGGKSNIDLSQPVHSLDSMRVSVEPRNGEEAENREKGSKKSKRKVENKEREREKSSLPVNSDTEDLINVMSTAQNSKLHDQRGLISEMNLELPEFLRIDLPSPAKQPISANNNNNHSNSKTQFPEHAELPVDVPYNGPRGSPSRAGTGNSRARILKMRNMEDLRLFTPVAPQIQRRKKISSADMEVSTVEVGDNEAVTPSAVDDDPFVINRWMQSVSCTPKYPYAPDLETTLVPASPITEQPELETATYVTPSTYVTSLDNHSSVTHDHKYTKRKVKV